MENNRISEEGKKMVQEQSMASKPKISFYDKDNNEYRYITSKDEIDLDQKISEIESLMRTQTGRGQSDDKKDELYIMAQKIWNDYANILREMKFSFYLNRKQQKYIIDLLGVHLDYDVNTIFFALELHDMLSRWDSVKMKSDNDILSFESTATEITYMYHLISKHVVKGLTKTSVLFAEMLRKIGELSKIIGFYDNYAKELSKQIQDWVASFEENVTLEVPKENNKELPSSSIKMSNDSSEDYSDGVVFEPSVGGVKISPKKKTSKDKA